MEDTFNIQDESGDRKYFTIIPNYILNHSTLYDRELYVQMKRMAGEKGTCYASRTTLAKQCGMSPRKVDASIKYLTEHKWIRKIGTKTVQTAGGPQQVGEYAIADLWKKNIEFYEEKNQGVARNAIPYTQRGSTDEAKGVAPGAHKEELIQEEPLNTSANAETNLLPDWHIEEEITRPKRTEPLPKTHEFTDIWNKYTDWEKLGKKGTPPNPSVKKSLLPVAKNTPTLTGALVRARNKFSTAEFEQAVKNYVNEVVNRRKDEKGYYEHRYTLYEFLVHKDVLAKYANK